MDITDIKNQGTTIKWLREHLRGAIYGINQAAYDKFTPYVGKKVWVKYYTGVKHQDVMEISGELLFGETPRESYTDKFLKTGYLVIQGYTVRFENIIDIQLLGQ